MTPVQPTQPAPSLTPVTTLTPPSVPTEVATMFVPGQIVASCVNENVAGTGLTVAGDRAPVTSHPLVAPVGTVTVANCPTTPVVEPNASVRAPAGVNAGPSTRRFA